MHPERHCSSASATAACCTLLLQPRRQFKVTHTYARVVGVAERPPTEGELALAEVPLPSHEAAPLPHHGGGGDGGSVRLGSALRFAAVEGFFIDAASGAVGAEGSPQAPSPSIQEVIFGLPAFCSFLVFVARPREWLHRPRLEPPPNAHAHSYEVIFV